jgi:signal transduction histidine kinase
VEADGLGRYPQEAEAAVYFCAVEALRSAIGPAGAAHASVRVSACNGELLFEVTGDGARPDGGGRWGADLRAMADRIDALGGEILVDSGPGRCTSINGRVPATVMS